VVRLWFRVQLTSHLHEREILALLVTTWDSGDFGPRGVDGSLLCEEILGDFLAADPKMRVAHDFSLEEAVIFIAEFPHLLPRCHGVRVVDATNPGDTCAEGSVKALPMA